MKKIALIYATALASVLIGSILNFALVSPATQLKWYGDFIPLRNTEFLASLWDGMIAIGFLLWAFGTGVWYQSGLTLMRKTA